MSHEQEPSITLKTDDGRSLEMNRENSTLYTFLGKTVIGDLEIDNSMFNHAFLTTGQNEQGQTVGMYFFRTHSVYREISQHMVDNHYPMQLNARHVPMCDLNAYFAEVDKTTAEFAGKLPDYIPDN